MDQKEKVKGTVWVWTVIGAAVGSWFGIAISSFARTNALLGGIAGCVLVGVLAYRSSAAQGGRAPGWLWRTKKK
jgi:hypothetical protein